MPEAEGLVKQDLGRRLVAVMFTDMVGYTALFQADERLAMDKRDRYVSAVERHHVSGLARCRSGRHRDPA
jgi:class 3 adenylate cyclase